MRIESPIIIEEFSPTTNTLKSTWRIKEVYVDSHDVARDEVKIHFCNRNNQEIVVPLLSANIRIYAQCIHEGKMTIRLNTSTPMHVMISKADPEMLKLFHSFLLQFTQQLTLEVKNRAKMAVQLFNKKTAMLKEQQLNDARRRLADKGDSFDEIDAMNFSKRSRNASKEKSKMDMLVDLHRRALRTIKENELNGMQGINSAMSTLGASNSGSYMGSDQSFNLFGATHTDDREPTTTFSARTATDQQRKHNESSINANVSSLLDDLLGDINDYNTPKNSATNTLQRNASHSLYAKPSTPAPSRTAAPSFDLHTRISLSELETLSMSQRKVLDVVASGASVFFSGPAGTGKSHLLGILKTILPARTAHFTSTTGITAVNLGGTTLWHWLGVNLSQNEGNTGPAKTKTFPTFGANPFAVQKSDNNSNKSLFGEDVVEAAVARIRKSNDTFSRLRTAQTLVIDEISMLSATSLSNLDLVLKTVRQNQSPMGGLQVIICGDFLQLPPVISGNSSSGIFTKPGNTATSSEPVFAFESPIWPRLFPPSQIVLLQRIFRQTDTSFVDILNKLRVGDAEDMSAQLVLALERGRIVEEAKKKGIDINALHSPSLQMRQSAEDLGGENSDASPDIHAELKRKISSIQSSLDVFETLRNFSDATWLLTRKYQVETLNTTHLQALKSETVTLTAHDTSVSPAHLQYLQRTCPAKDTIQLKVGALVILTKNVNVADGLCNGARGVILRFTSEKLPVVFFPYRKKTVVVKRERYPLIIGGQVVAEREMIPLELAWAVSVHKSQGLTLDKAIVDISQVFEYGQAYVALSRLRSLDGLALVGYNPQFVCAHPLVKRFYTEMEKLQ